MDHLPYRFPSHRSPVLARRGMVATSQPLAAQAGLAVLQAGGTAADAAVAAAAVLCVVEPFSTGIGGDAFFLYREAATGRVYAYNGSGRSPAGADPENLRRRGLEEVPTLGPIPVTVPGAVRAWADLLARFGRRSLAENLVPAVAYAEEGFPVSPLIARGWQLLEPKLRDQNPDGAGEELLPGGRAPRAGEVVRLPTLARTLARIAEEGPDLLYRGELAERIAARVRELGGWLSAEDLADHEGRWGEPLAVEYRGVRVYEHPPNGQGLAALLALRILDGFEGAPPPWEDPEALHREVEAMRLAFADARFYVADPDLAPAPLEALLDPAYAARRRALIGPRAGTYRRGTPERASDTVYLAVVDGEGNACSFIQSLYMGFGSGIVVPGTGIALQNRGACFVLEPGHPNELGPRKRPYHTILPGLAERDGALWLTFGVMGGFMQPQGHVQVLRNLIDRGMDPQTALDAPRWCVLPDGRLALEEGYPWSTAADAARRGHRVVPVSGLERRLFGGGQVILRDPQTGVLWGGSEPRKDGCAVGW